MPDTWIKGRNLGGLGRVRYEMHKQRPDKFIPIAIVYGRI